MKRELLVVGLSHKSAPVAVRERVAFSGEALASLLRGLKAQPGVDEALVVSTCNRVEVYLVGEDPREARRIFQERAPGCDPHLYERQGGEAVRHLFRVAASLDSMVLGEPQILGQVKDAFAAARDAQSVGSTLDRLMTRALSAAKRVRTETEVAKGAGSVSQVAVDLCRKIFGELEGKAVLLVGAGKMSTLSAKALASTGANKVRVTNRSPERAAELAAQVGGEARPWEKLTDLIVEADVVLSSTSAPGFVITRELAQHVVKARRHRTLCLIDLAVPRDVDPACADLDNVFAYDIDDLEKVVESTREARAGEAIRAEAIVETEMQAFLRERETRAALPVLASLRRRAEEIALAEAERTLAAVGDRLDDKARKSVEAMARAIVNKLLHQPTARLKQAAAEGDGTLPSAVAELFGVSADEGAGEPANVVPLAEHKK